MGRSIDEKIVKLSMDNKDLVSKARESSSIFDKLKAMFKKTDGVTMDKSTRSLSKFNAEAKKTNLDSLKNAIEPVQQGLTAMGVIGVTALMNITNRAVDTGLALTKSLTLDGMMDGFQEYELKMGSIQTILANTARHGTTLKEVSANLDELNTYADKTIYNFGDMTRNIGLFTNAGIKIEDATAMIKGFSNEAATSGTTAMQASGAAYQLSQALSAGVIRLQDWRSLQNVGMGNKNMQEGLIEIAEAMGKFTEETTDAETVSKDFNSSLEDKWLTADVMENYLKIQAEGNEEVNRSMMKQIGLSDKQINAFIKQQKTAEEAATKVRTFSQLIDTAKEAIGSGWTESWEMLIGDFEVATELWTGVNNVLDKMIADSARTRNEIIKSFVDMGGRKFAIDGIANVFKGLLVILNSVKTAFQNVFPPVTAIQLTNMAARFRDLAESLIPSESTAKKLTTVFQGLFSIIDIGIKFVKMIANAFLDMIPSSLGGDLLDLLVNVSELVIQFDKTLTPSNAFANTLKAISNVIRGTIEGIVGFVKGLGNVGSILKSIGGGITSVFEVIGKNAGKALSKFDFNSLMNTAAIGAIIAGVNKIQKTFESFGKVGDVFKGTVDSFKKGIENIGGLTDALESMTRAVNIASIVAIAGAVLMLSIAFKTISDIEAEDIFKSLEVLGLALAGLGFTMSRIARMNFKSGWQAAATLTALAQALLIVSLALKVMSTIDVHQMGVAMLGLAGSMTIMIVALKAMSKMSGKIGGTAGALLVLASSLLVISGAMKVFASISWEGIAKGLSTMAATLTMFALFTKAVQKSKLNMATATSVLIISGAMVVMAGAIAALGYMNTDAVIQGSLAIAGILTVLATFTKVVSGSKLMSTAVGLTILAGGLMVISGAISILGGMSVESLAKGLISLSVGLGAMVIALNLAKGTMGGAIALGVAAGAISLFTPAIMLLSQLSFGQLAVGLLAIGGTFAIVAAAALLLGPASLALIPFALSITAVALAVGAAGLVLLGFGAALSTLAAMTAAGVVSIIATLGLLIAGLITLVPQMVQLGVEMLKGLIGGIKQLVPQLVETGFTIIDKFLESAKTHVPNIVEVGIQLITQLILGIAQEAPRLMEAATQLIISLVAGLANTLRENNEVLIAAVLSLVESILEVIVTALEGIVTTMFGWIPGVKQVAGQVGDAARGGLRDYFNEAITTADAAAGVGGFNSGLESGADGAYSAGSTVAGQGKAGLGSEIATPEGSTLGNGWNQALDSTGGAAYTAGSTVAGKGKSGLGSKDGNREGNTMGSTYSRGVSSRGGEAGAAGRGLASKAKAEMGSISSEDTGSNFGSGFARGISSMLDGVVSAASSLASAAVKTVKKVLDVRSPSRVMRKVGVHFGEGFVGGTEDMYDETYSSSAGLAQRAVDGFMSISDDLTGALDDAINFAPVITPVLDTSNLKTLDLSKSLPVISNTGLAEVSEGTTNVTINVTGYDKSPRELAKEIERIIVRR